MKKAFTLAEIMIVLTVIGILTAILLPIAFQASPDEEAVKFKKANSTMGTIIRELTNTEKFYSNGDLGTMPNGTLVTGNKYLCDSISEVVSYKTKDCSGSDSGTSMSSHTALTVDQIKTTISGWENTLSSTVSGGYINSTDGIMWIIPNAEAYGKKDASGTRKYCDPADDSVGCTKSDGFDINFRAICFDVDGNSDGVKPFCYGVRSDGKIYTSTRVDCWVNCPVQKSEQTCLEQCG